jgi:hypothetical protein
MRPCHQEAGSLPLNIDGPLRMIQPTLCEVTLCDLCGYIIEVPLISTGLSWDAHFLNPAAML